MKTEDHAVAAGHSVDPARCQEAFEALMGRPLPETSRESNMKITIYDWSTGASETTNHPSTGCTEITHK
ncbi:hypothetical protein [Streptomyces sp. Inha503]|uniref:hypothetical protein n=1 Tax=Streptomyces sp. Inha503 TaxID=3383314 RepID=UPI00399F067F